ncbi:MAG: TolC family protein [Chitinophagaceae bacterium]|nr:TolC family protein [Chitinophagaceae bacterium]
MMMKRFVFFLLVTLFAYNVKAQQPLSLQDAVNLALKKSLDLQIARNNIEISSINNNIGMAGGLPTVSATLSETEQINTVNQKLNSGQTIQRNWAVGNNLNANVTGSQLLFNGFRVIATKHRLEELERLSQQQLNVQVQNVMGDVMLQYYDVVRQQDYIKTIEQAIAAAKQRLSLVQVKQSVGLANNADLYQAQIDVNTLNQNLRQQYLVIQQAKTTFLNSLSVPPDSNVVISDTIVVDRSLDLSSIQAELRNSPEYQAATTQININHFLEKETAAQRYPSVRANAGLNYGRSQSAAGLTLLNQSYGPTLGLSVNIPVYNGGIFKRQQRIASINTENAILQRDLILQQLNTTAVSSWESYEANIVQADSARKNYALSGKLLDLTLLRFQLGQATIVEVRDAQQSFEQAGYQLTNINYAAKAAEITLKRLAGRLSL